MEIYYNGPMQLRFIRPGARVYSYGIGYHEYIIDVSNGDIFFTKDIYASTQLEDKELAIIEYGDWKDLSKDFNKI